ncbi:MAG: TonB-dependent vitamin B12 receptor [Rhodanobacter sp. 68-29]|nr:TonB-dependent vitamin B12 receptor [Rhodanobacter sp.]ODU73211.1 MAG: TonB-dependent vitamin B12 receptor [Rhodanobacter sp. SCN 69-32]OJY57174.1 MAG: TonB-dependent vitamin B12 receptor [Rhodanobacter sp. 68-29]
MKKTLLAAALLCCLPAAHAADQDDASTLNPVIVTATRTPITADDALSSVSVITRADIERLQPLSVQDLLTGLPGINFAQSGGLGQLGTLFLRGTNSTHTLVLVDGIRIGSATAGFARLEQIPVEQIERIEIVRGPRSSLYGSDAIGGVIQIFTRHGQPNGGLAPSLSVTAGSHGLAGTSAGISGGDAHAWYNLSLGGQYTSGFPACRLGAAEAMAGCFADDPRNDAFRNWNGALNAGYRWDNGTELAGDWLRSKSFVEYAGSPYGSNRAVNEQRVAGARLSFSPLEAWKVTLNAGQGKDLATTYYQGSYYGQYYPLQQTGYANSRRNQASWQNDVALAANQLLTVGADWQQDHVDSSTAYLESRRSDTGVFAQYQGTFGRNELQASVRRDHDSQFGNHSTGALAWGYAFDHGLRLSASYGSAFHAPTFNDLYYPPFFGTPSANPELKPETSHSTELGLQQQLAGWHWAVNAYETRINRMIVLDPAQNYVPFNLSRARIRGVEGQLGATLAGWQVQGYLTLQQPKNDDGGANNGKLLPRRPERTARLDIDRRFGAFGVGSTWYLAGHSYDDVANTHRLGGYGTLALRANWQFAPDWQVEGKLANAFDHHYETVWYYNQPGRTWMLTLRYRPVAR